MTKVDKPETQNDDSGTEPHRDFRRPIEISYAAMSGVSRAALKFASASTGGMLQQAAVVEPVDSFECGVFHRVEATPWSTAVNDLRLEEAVDRLGERVVIAVTDTPDRSFNPGLGQALGVFDRQVRAGAQCIDAGSIQINRDDSACWQAGAEWE